MIVVTMVRWLLGRKARICWALREVASPSFKLSLKELRVLRVKFGEDGWLSESELLETVEICGWGWEGDCDTACAGCEAFFISSLWRLMSFILLLNSSISCWWESLKKNVSIIFSIYGCPKEMRGFPNILPKSQQILIFFISFL